jgi:peptidoglycan hydrolase CwlO-like protein
MASRTSNRTLASERACLHKSCQALDEKLELLQANVEALRAKRTSLQEDFVLLQSHVNSTGNKIEEIEVSVYEDSFSRGSLIGVTGMRTDRDAC